MQQDAAILWPDNLPRNLAEALRLRIAQSADGLYTEQDRPGELQHQTVSALHARASAIQTALSHELAGEKRDVVLYVRSLFDFVPAMWACIFSGANVFAIQAQTATARGFEIKARLEHVKPKLKKPLLLSTQVLLDQLETSLDDDFCIVRLDDLAIHSLAVEERPDSFPAESAESGACLLIPTSGSVSRPKIAMVSHSAVLHRAVALGFAQGNDVAINFQPFDGISGGNVIWPQQRNVYLQPDRLAASPLDLLRLTGQFGAKSLRLPSSMAAMITAHLDMTSERFNLSCLQRVAFGAEMISEKSVQKFCAKIVDRGAADLHVAYGYGMTETGPICATQRLPLADIARRDPDNQQPVAVGHCFSNYALRIVDEGGFELPRGESGEVECWSPTNLFSGYYEDEKLTADSRSTDGWFKTGDVGFVDDRGLTLTGRRKSTIVIRGRKISLEMIELALRSLPELAATAVACAPIKRQGDATEELAVFFVPLPTQQLSLNSLCRRIVGKVAQAASIRVAHVVPLTAQQFPRTSTGKPRRFELAERYGHGEWSSYDLMAEDDGHESSAGVGEMESELITTLAALWKSALNLNFSPNGCANFYELGGDSLASAELLFALEKKFGCELPFDLLFANPTITGMAQSIEQTQPAAVQRPLNGGDDVAHKVKAYLASWRGQRRSEGAMIVGTNVEGRQPPLFWVFQDEYEFRQLAAGLGIDQPLYGMRSLVGIRKTPDYTDDVVGAIGRHYCQEILAIAGGAPFVLGGNCQGAIIALSLARRLKRLAKAELPVILMEWTFNRGPYEGPTSILYGTESHTVKIYENSNVMIPDWRRDFPKATVLPIPGRHGEFFRDHNIDGLTTAIQTILSSATGITSR